MLFSEETPSFGLTLLEEAAQCVARLSERQAAPKKTAAAAPPLTSKEALRQAQAEGLTLPRTIRANSNTGYLGVGLH